MNLKLVNSQKRERHTPLNKVSPDQLNKRFKKNEFIVYFLNILCILHQKQNKTCLETQCLSPSGGSRASLSKRARALLCSDKVLPHNKQTCSVKE